MSIGSTIGPCESLTRSGSRDSERGGGGGGGGGGVTRPVLAAAGFNRTTSSFTRTGSHSSGGGWGSRASVTRPFSAGVSSGAAFYSQVVARQVSL